MDISVLFDIGVILVLLISAGVSFFRGLIREVLTILGALGGGFAALSFGPSVVPLTSSWFGIEKGKDAGELFGLIPMELAAQITAYAGIFILVFVILQLASHLISNAAQALGLGPVDRTLGIFFGLARGLLLISILYLPFHLVLSDDTKKDWFEKSQTMVFVKGVTEWLISFVPQDKSKEDMVNETRDSLKKIDVLGDKKITDTDKDKANQDNLNQKADGYSHDTRKTLDALIDGQTKPPGKTYND
jgi:membrane protein required for colicin V production